MHEKIVKLEERRAKILEGGGAKRVAARATPGMHSSPRRIRVRDSFFVIV